MEGNRLTQTEPAGAQVGTPAGPAGASERLSHEELTELLNTAIARNSEAQRQADALSGTATLDDAREIARQVGIPEEHVTAAAEELQRRKLRHQRREIARSRRVMRFFGGVALLGIAAGMALIFSGFTQFVVVLGIALAAALLGARWAFGPISDEEADRIELPPAPGTCRVCGRPAYSPHATFCEEHRYKGPGAG